MLNIAVVTDSSAHFANPQLVRELGVTVVANRITVGNRTYLEGVDLSPEEAMRLFSARTQPPTITAPSVSDYFEHFQRVGSSASAIISIHASRELTTSYANAREAAAQLAGLCPIIVFDSQTIGAAQAMVVKFAVEAARTQPTMDDVVRILRGSMERLYSVFYVDSIDFLLHNGIMEPAQAILSAMLTVKPVLTIENGRIVPMEKVRSRAQAIERLVEFAVEFTEIEDALIIQHKPGLSEQTRTLQDRLSVEFPGRQFEYSMYGPSLAALIGTDATGLVVFESQTDRMDEDDF